MQQVSIIGILAAAQSLIILTAGIDLSVAAIMILMSVIMGKACRCRLVFQSLIAIPIGMLGGMLAGCVERPSRHAREAAALHCDAGYLERVLSP